MAFEAQGQGHLQDQMSKLYKKISNVKIVTKIHITGTTLSFQGFYMHFRISFYILYYSSIKVPSVFKPKRGSLLVTMDTYR